MAWTSRITRDDAHASRVDWARELVVFRKPRVFDPARDKIYDYGSIQAKCDGIRCIVAFHPDGGKGSFHAFTTKPTDLVQTNPNHPMWSSLAERTRLGEWLDGELVVPGKGREAVKTALAENDPELRFMCFGASFIDHYASIADANVSLIKRELGCPPCAWIEGLGGVSREFIASEGCYDGVVYKDSMYGRWRKLKNKLTIDLVVTRVIPGVGKYSGMCGSLAGSVARCENGMASQWIEVARCGMMNDTVRERISESDVGRVFEAAYERVGSCGRLQHPRFIAWRDDEKDPWQCFADQDPKLLEYWNKT